MPTTSAASVAATSESSFDCWNLSVTTAGWVEGILSKFLGPSLACRVARTATVCFRLISLDILL